MSFFWNTLYFCRCVWCVCANPFLFFFSSLGARREWSWHLVWIFRWTDRLEHTIYTLSRKTETLLVEIIEFGGNTYCCLGRELCNEINSMGGDGVGKIQSLATDGPGFKFYWVLTVWPWASYSFSPNLSFLVCKIG